MNDDTDPAEIARRLAEPFDPDEVKWKAQTVSGARCLAVCFVDARVVMDRLDAVAGTDGWQDQYQVLPDGSVVCTLIVRFGPRHWVAKQDVGGQSEQPDEGDRTKAAFSDALKRAAVKFGVGRYLYRLKPQWVDYDPQKKRITGTPRLPGAVAPKPAPEARGTPEPGAGPAPAKEKKYAGVADCVAKADAGAVKEGLAAAGALTAAITEALRGDHGGDVAAWPEKAVLDWLKGWFADARGRAPVLPEQEEQIAAALKRAGRDWKDARARLSLPPDASLGSITRGQAAEVLEMLSRMPDAQRPARR